jgi:manganese/zinc/iron transport system permease protein
VGVFLVLRRMAMMGDAISHTVFFGIVVAFLLVREINSPWLVVGATAVGVLTVWLTELLTNTRRVREDTAIGLVFPFLFSLGVILVSMFAKNAHIDTHVVLLGEPALAPLRPAGAVRHRPAAQHLGDRRNFPDQRGVSRPVLQRAEACHV